MVLLSVKDGSNTRRFIEKYGISPLPIRFVAPEDLRERTTTASVIVMYFPGHAPESRVSLTRVFESYGPVIMAKHSTSYREYGENPERYYEFLASQSLDLLWSVTKGSQTRVILGGTSVGGPAVMQAALLYANFEQELDIGGLIFNVTGVQRENATPALLFGLKIGSLVYERAPRQVKNLKLGLTPSKRKGELLPHFDLEIISKEEHWKVEEEGRNRTVEEHVGRIAALKAAFERPSLPNLARLTPETAQIFRNLYVCFSKTPVLVIETTWWEKHRAFRSGSALLTIKDYLPGVSFSPVPRHEGAQYTQQFQKAVRGFMEKRVLAESRS